MSILRRVLPELVKNGYIRVEDNSGRVLEADEVYFFDEGMELFVPEIGKIVGFGAYTIAIKPYRHHCPSGLVEPVLILTEDAEKADLYEKVLGLGVQRLDLEELRQEALKDWLDYIEVENEEEAEENGEYFDWFDWDAMSIEPWLDFICSESGLHAFWTEELSLAKEEEGRTEIDIDEDFCRDVTRAICSCFISSSFAEQVLDGEAYDLYPSWLKMDDEEIEDYIKEENVSDTIAQILFDANKVSEIIFEHRGDSGCSIDLHENQFVVDHKMRVRVIDFLSFG